MLANAACLEPAAGFLKHVEQVARANGALLIADEVLMGFRLRPGLASHHIGLDPDLATLGKAIGSGVPVAAVIGRSEVMDAFEATKGLRGGTYSGNPVACVAVDVTMRLLAEQDYAALQARGNALREAIVDAFAAHGLAAATTGYGDVFSIWFAAAPPATYAEAIALANPARSLELHLQLRRAGVIVMPSAYGRLYTTFAHDEEAIALTKAGFAQAAAAMV
jgi:glutamate-1-semialdehyde 2,1-aminomutase